MCGRGRGQLRHLPVLRRVHGTLDRKSTRLNSSHLGISYAVFCLKKKKEAQHLAGRRRRRPAARPGLHHYDDVRQDGVLRDRMLALCLPFLQCSQTCLDAALRPGACVREILMFFFDATGTTQVYTLSLHDALPILISNVWSWSRSAPTLASAPTSPRDPRSEEHTSELQSLRHLVCRLLLEKKKGSATPGWPAAPPPRRQARPPPLRRRPTGWRPARPYACALFTVSPVLANLPGRGATAGCLRA